MYRTADGCRRPGARTSVNCHIHPLRLVGRSGHRHELSLSSLEAVIIHSEAPRAQTPNRFGETLETRVAASSLPARFNSIDCASSMPLARDQLVPARDMMEWERGGSGTVMDNAGLSRVNWVAAHITHTAAAPYRHAVVPGYRPATALLPPCY